MDNQIKAKIDEDMAIARFCRNQAERNQVTRGLANGAMSKVPMHLFFSLIALVGVLLIVTR